MPGKEFFKKNESGEFFDNEKISPREINLDDSDEYVVTPEMAEEVATAKRASEDKIKSWQTFNDEEYSKQKSLPQLLKEKGTEFIQPKNETFTTKFSPAEITKIHNLLENKSSIEALEKLIDIIYKYTRFPQILFNKIDNDEERGEFLFKTIAEEYGKEILKPLLNNKLRVNKISALYGALYGLVGLVNQSSQLSPEEKNTILKPMSLIGLKKIVSTGELYKSMNIEEKMKFTTNLSNKAEEFLQALRELAANHS